MYEWYRNIGKHSDCRLCGKKLRERLPIVPDAKRRPRSYKSDLQSYKFEAEDECGTLTEFFRLLLG
jgi:hypothetical protein